MTRPSEPSLSGTAVLDGRAIYSTVVGAPLFVAAVQTLAPADAEIYLEVTSVGWVPIRIVDQVITAVARAAKRDPLVLNRDVSRLAVERTVKTVWRPFLRLTTDNALITRAPLMYARAYSHGKLEAQKLGGNAARLVVGGWSTMTDLQIAGFGAGVQAVLSVAGRADVGVKASREAGTIAFHVTWR